jgi:predicted ABC-class ATPase
LLVDGSFFALMPDRRIESFDRVAPPALSARSAVEGLERTYVSRETTMKDIRELERAFRSLDGQGYKAYKGVAGAYADDGFELHVDHVQGDPFAEPSRLRVRVPSGEAGYPPWTRSSATRARAAADFVNRRLAEALADRSRGRGSGKSGELSVLVPGQEVLERTSMTLAADGSLVARFRAGLPARGRRILGAEAVDLLAEVVGAVRGSLFFAALDAEALREHIETVEDAVSLREQLSQHGLIAFVAEGAGLARRSGVDDRPLPRETAVPFESPESLRRTLHAPSAGRVEGMGVPEGVTLIVGGGYHGKSTLLRALERGVYDHIPGDGRERVVTVAGAAKVRAEDGRHVAGTDISNFIGNLPGGVDTSRFHSENASGSTSQAAAIVEALEVGATALLLDEDTSATNFMIRDARMQRLIAAEQEPITPFIDRARELHRTLGVSTTVVIGGSGDYFEVADTVIALRDYRPTEVTGGARAVAAALPSARVAEAAPWRSIRERSPDPRSMDPSRGHREVSIRILSRDRVQFGHEHIDLGAVEQIVETAQTRAMAYAMENARGRAIDGKRTLAECIAEIMAGIERQGLASIHPHEIGELAAFRGLELTAFLNRLRSLATRPRPEETTVDSRGEP